MGVLGRELWENLSVTSTEIQRTRVFLHMSTRRGQNQIIHFRLITQDPPSPSLQMTTSQAERMKREEQ